MRRRGAVRLMLGAWVAGGLAFWGTKSHAQNGVSREYQLKAVFLLNFARFTEWPSSAFENPHAPLVIATLGKNPFNDALEDVVRGETVNGRPIAVAHYSSLESIEKAHILFICESESGQIEKLINAFSGKPILAVSDLENFAVRGGMVRFITKNNKIGLRVNLGTLKASQLTMSSKLLRSAELVGTLD
ncbi:MAG: YfiR family protein [Verrucomicrobiales bacterium]|nr:YfiR family protein [Verrucomicrobiales bacterium]